MADLQSHIVSIASLGRPVLREIAAQAARKEGDIASARRGLIDLAGRRAYCAAHKPLDRVTRMFGYLPGGIA